MATDRLRQAEKHQFIEKFDQKLQEHLKLRNHNTLRFDELQEKYTALNHSNEQLEQLNHQLQEQLDKHRQEATHYRQQYELLRAQVVSNSPAQYSLVGRESEREVRRLQELL
jgi:predicted nuclease with TOPRIM domain